MRTEKFLAVTLLRVQLFIFLVSYYFLFFVSFDDTISGELNMVIKDSEAHTDSVWASDGARLLLVVRHQADGERGSASL